jgi:hypothetical protein
MSNRSAAIFLLAIKRLACGICSSVSFRKNSLGKKV